ncbi:hypothetical protein HHA01_26660 [Halomonas halmophila]|uniref:Uncharacterized protein n=1 Tax=Halomonas halmophila TaxID=252 RepID=A0A4Y4F0T0_9GAMM|nr:hypothetical protein HHA01_26660 [Halomonas halmophila]
MLQVLVAGAAGEQHEQTFAQLHALAMLVSEGQQLRRVVQSCQGSMSHPAVVIDGKPLQCLALAVIVGIEVGGRLAADAGVWMSPAGGEEST